MKRVKFTKNREQTLREQGIDAERPGPVLRDFRTVLDYVGVPGVKAAGKYHLLPIESISELDAKLSRPLHLEMKRPQLRSHPYLWGLQLLLRASGLCRLQGSGAQTRLVVSWRATAKRRINIRVGRSDAP